MTSYSTLVWLQFIDIYIYFFRKLFQSTRIYIKGILNGRPATLCLVWSFWFDVEFCLEQVQQYCIFCFFIYLHLICHPSSWKTFLGFLNCLLNFKFLTEAWTLVKTKQQYHVVLLPTGLVRAGFVSGTMGKLGHGHFGWASWALHGAWCMASMHGGARGVVHGGVPDGGLGKSMCIPAPPPISKVHPTSYTRLPGCHAPMHHPCTDAMHGPACPSSQTQIRPRLTCR